MSNDDIKAGEAIIVVCAEDSYLMGHFVALRDYNEYEVYLAFEGRYTGPQYRESEHFLNYLVKRGYLFPLPNSNYRRVYV